MAGSMGSVVGAFVQAINAALQQLRVSLLFACGGARMHLGGLMQMAKTSAA